MASHDADFVVSGAAAQRGRELLLLLLLRRKLKVLSQLRVESARVMEEQVLSLSEDSSLVVEAMDMVVTYMCGNV